MLSFRDLLLQASNISGLTATGHTTTTIMYTYKEMGIGLSLSMVGNMYQGIGSQLRVEKHGQEVIGSVIIVN